LYGHAQVPWYAAIDSRMSSCLISSSVVGWSFAVLHEDATTKATMLIRIVFRIMDIECIKQSKRAEFGGK
jgi:hypothetical protein